MFQTEMSNYPETLRDQIDTIFRLKEGDFDQLFTHLNQARQNFDSMASISQQILANSKLLYAFSSLLRLRVIRTFQDKTHPILLVLTDGQSAIDPTRQQSLFEEDSHDDHKLVIKALSAVLRVAIEIFYPDENFCMEHKLFLADELDTNVLYVSAIFSQHGVGMLLHKRLVLACQNGAFGKVSEEDVPFYPTAGSLRQGPEPPALHHNASSSTPEQLTLLLGLLSPGVVLTEDQK